MIFGIGTDIVRVARMQEDIDRFGERFAARILTANELHEYRQNSNKANFLARRFAAKEAAAKALGTGFSRGVQLHDIEVAHDAQGKPLLEFRGRAREFLQEKSITIAHISLADEQDHAVAFVTLETG
ncbi:MAG: holo-ACP synthase [Candidatus Muproteobacteria bacterium RIFCSPHIGHO2_12_FULL_60_33]|uniref:Holo-[acyl-carrier-protein] synthase n=1 Tax=Candidatus Muproteobacteria bacterium RIFCSPLOWO2_01_FULL_60_18 TaxID=1817768 RepID=A0A1F6TYL8_9PROT|nr:MAG: holo-ACP synthase [Candidatus Muproteobacteria bacterium RIFCSPLOWO2_01_FULL_60_18]OGI53160.1 MAG: holo-ACP synthase [Candidatus Muproteobacteria bacterium RIFCSPHIGHO2_01_60_12]OGI56537.1 MAG: holo-ACP synthase [Candidatus Muproteobacteria bacterium RIFCSPHIGHO2_02_FULL_60_13]OGI56603.1 MAG: holo-ACP synthase [Candidatus Muproteobacteria bacterium RIFCSPHIGHO2_12_FULL_60_33]OGI59427.1 MAG: holo-ACP synthase [Candidatus Muproteobacteria bacterium RIFCSPHIGHO2_01_FULL_61_200]